MHDRRQRVPRRLGLLARLALVVLGVVVGAVMAEVVARILLPAPLAAAAPQVHMQADPVCGYTHRPGQRAYTLEGRATINRHGFRGPDWPIEKPAGTYRIALLGDSYVFGQGVADEDTFARTLERTLDDALGGSREGAPGPTGSHDVAHVEVLNFGVMGWDTGHEMAALEEHVLRFAPDLVLLHFTLNDLYRMPRELYPSYTAVIATEEERRPGLRSRAREALRRSRVLMAAWDAWSARRPGDPMNALVRTYDAEGQRPTLAGKTAGSWAFVGKSLERLAALGRERGFRAGLVVMPVPDEVLDLRAAAGPPYAEVLHARAHALGLLAIDLLPDLRASGLGTGLLLPYDNHFSPAGHRVIAATLARAIAPEVASAASRALPAPVAPEAPPEAVKPGKKALKE